MDAFLKQHGDALIDRLMQMITIPGVCVEGGSAIRQMADEAASEVRAAGLETRTEETGGHPVVLGTSGPSDAPFTLMLYGHYDVFPVSGQAGWATNPFEPVLDGDRIWGRGAGDNKGQFLAMLAALRWWKSQPGGLPIRVKVILEGEEEAGSKHLPEFVERNRAELAADLCVYSDGPMLPGDERPCCSGRAALWSWSSAAQGLCSRCILATSAASSPTPSWSLPAASPSSSRRTAICRRTASTWAFRCRPRGSGTRCEP